MHLFCRHCYRGEHHFWRRAIAELGRSMMLDLPPDFKAGAVRRARLINGVRQD
jgi:hypothetical protein